jgi:hypothetical protein
MNALQEHNVDIMAIKEIKLIGHNIMNAHHLIDFPPTGERKHVITTAFTCAHETT